MKNVLGVVVALHMALFVAATVDAAAVRQVYLKDGGIIECQSFSKRNGKVVVVVNRDVILELSPDEVQMQRTFAHMTDRHRRTTAQAPDKPAGTATTAKSGAPKGAAKQAAAPAKAVSPSPAPASPQAATASAKKGEPTPPTAANTAATAATTKTAPAATSPKPAAKPPAAAPAAPPVRKTLPMTPRKPADTASTLMAGTAGMGILAGFLLVVLVLVVSCWKVFTKAGEAGWKSIIPVYNVFVLVIMAGKPWWWFLLLCIPVVNFVIWILVSIDLAKKFNQGFLFGLGLAFLGIIFFPIRDEAAILPELSR